MHRNLFLSLTAIAFLFSLSASAASVFKVSKGDSVVYIGGTMHVLSKTDYPLPSAYKTAYEQSQTLIFETDMAAMSTPEFQQQSLSLLTYTDGRTLEDVLAPDTVQKLKNHLSARGVPFDAVKTMKPGYAGITLSVVEFSIIGLDAQGVDAYYHKTALADKKKIEWLESPTEQLMFLSKMGENNSDEYILYSLNDIKNLPDSVAKLKSAWLSGNMDELEAVGITPWLNDYPELYDLILTQRNNNWMRSLDDMFKTAETEFVLVGALHLAGEDGLLKQLKDKGYSVSQI